MTATGVDLTEDRGYVLHNGFLQVVVCVPRSWDDARIEDWVNSENPAGTTHGWIVCTEDIELSDGTTPPRFDCPDDPNRIHVFLAC